jgi:glycosyltransferase involved in cell wall biosynthesis
VAIVGAARRRTAVVVPVHADPDGLRTTLESLRDVDVEVIVALDGPHAATEAVARDAGAEVVVGQQHRGSYAARNLGIDRLGDEVDHVLFTDAGCVVRSGWVEAHVDALGRAELSAGAVDVLTGIPPTPAEWVDARRYLRQEAYVADGFAATCNLAVRREVLREIRFDETLESGGDRALCRQAIAAGHRLVYTPSAVVAHPARRTAASVLAKAARIGRGLAALPPEARPTRLPVPRLQRGLARDGMRRHRRGLLWGARVALLDQRRVRATANAARDAGWRAAGTHAVVLLNARWATLADHNTRWRRVVQAWVARDDIASVTVVDYPTFAPRRLVALHRLAREVPSWLPGARVLAVDVPLPPRPTPVDDVVWRAVARAVDRELPHGDRVVIATTPLWVPLARRLRARTRALDTMGDWRALPSVQHQRRRIDAGYREAAGLDIVTAVSDGMAGALADIGVRARVVGNGVDVDAFAGEPPAPAGLPAAPFAVYVGAIEGRVDIDLLEAVAAAGLATVVAGPASGAIAARLRRSGLHWLGPVPTDLVPGLLVRASVGLLPHRRSALTASMDPMKVLEYLAAGLPVVATGVPVTPDVADRVDVVDDEAFAAAAVAAAAAPRGPRPDPAVAGRDWADVADRLLDCYLHP